MDVDFEVPGCPIDRQELLRVLSVLLSGGVPRLPNTSCFGLEGVRAETLVMAMDLAGIAISAGSACSSGKVQPSHVLRAMGASEEEAGTAIRVSFGWNSDKDDLELFISAWLKHMRRSLAA